MAFCKYKLTFQVPGDSPLEFLMAMASLHMFTNESVGVAVHICLLSAFVMILRQKA